VIRGLGLEKATVICQKDEQINIKGNTSYFCDDALVAIPY
jgi:hypothetical protein